MKNEKYWKKRQEEKLSSILDDAQVASEYVSDIYSKASLYTQSKINGIFEKYRDGHGLSNADAKEMLDSLLSDRDYNQIKRILENNPKTKQRKELLKKATAHLKNVIVDSTDELFMDYVKKVNGQVLIRGLRSTTDFDYELQYAQSNQYLNSQIEIMYLMTKPSHSFISSSVVKEIASYHKPLTGLVPECVEDALKKVYQDQ